MPAITRLLGWKEDELQLAWEWHTYSRRSALGRLEAMRDDVYKRPLPYKIKCVQEFDCSKIDLNNASTMGRNVWGTFEAPYYLTSKYRGSPLKMRPNDPDSDTSKAATTHTVEFLVSIPCSVLAEQEKESGRPPPAKLVQAGHTFFMTMKETQTGPFVNVATRNRWVTFTTQWLGMSHYDFPLLASLFLGYQSDIAVLAEMTMQGQINHISLARLVRESLVNETALQSSKTHAPYFDPSSLYYYGISQGSILGSAYTALSTEVKKAALMVA